MVVQQETLTPHRTVDASGVPKRVLIAEDDAAIAAMLAKALKRAYVVTVVSDGLEALQALETSAARFDLALLDLLMPGVDGLAVLRQVRRQPDAPRCVMMTAWTICWPVDMLLEEGAAAVLVKPFDLHEALAVVARQLLISR